MKVSLVDVIVETIDLINALDNDDICEMLIELPEDRFNDVLRRRSRAPEKHPLDAYVADAIDLLRDSRADEALLLLERAARPKFKTLADFELSLRQVKAA